MAKIQVELDELENTIIGIYKALKGTKTKGDAIKLIILEHKELVDKLK